MSGLPKSGHGWAIYEYTPELDAAAISGTQPGRLHCTACTPPALLREVTMPRSPLLLTPALVARNFVACVSYKTNTDGLGCVSHMCDGLNHPGRNLW
jgi:hypothetical protein